MTKFEFFRLGIPCTVQTVNKSRLANYKADVRRIASARWPGDADVITTDVKAVISYYYRGADEIDVDNIIKPLLDQLNGLVYEDDRQIVEVTCRKFRLPASDIHTEKASPELRLALRSAQSFVHVRVEWENLMESGGNRPNRQEAMRVREAMRAYRAAITRAEPALADANPVFLDKEGINRLLAIGPSRAAVNLVGSFAAFEASLRLAFRNVGIAPRSSTTDALLVVATSRGFIDQHEFDVATRISQTRDAIMHGFAHDEPNDADLLMLIELAHRVLNESENATLQYG